MAGEREVIPDNAKAIQLPRGKVAIVDVEDYERLSKFDWRLSGKDGCDYAVRRIGGTSIQILMHREILGDIPKGKDVDHINGDRFDNRRCNLRVVTRSVNIQNNEKRRNYRLPETVNPLQATLARLGISPIQLLQELNWIGSAKPKSPMSLQNGFAKIAGRVKMSFDEGLAIQEALKKLTGKAIKNEDVLTGK